MTLYILVPVIKFYHRNKKDDKNNQMQEIEAKSIAEETLTVLPNPPIVLMIQTELCEKTLKSWLLDHVNDRRKKTVVNFFEQVCGS